MPRCWRSCAPVAGLGSGVVVHTAFQGSPWATHTERREAGHGGCGDEGRAWWGDGPRMGLRSRDREAAGWGWEGAGAGPGRLTRTQEGQIAGGRGVCALGAEPPLVRVQKSPVTGPGRGWREQAGKHDQYARSTNYVSAQDTKRWLERKLPEGVDEGVDDGLDGDRRSTE